MLWLNRKGITLVEIMVVMAVIGLLPAIVIPNFIKNREIAQKNTCMCHLKQIDSAKQLWALEYNKSSKDPAPTPEAIANYVKNGFPTCPAGGIYAIENIGTAPFCSIHSTGAQILLNGLVDMVLDIGFGGRKATLSAPDHPSYGSVNLEALDKYAWTGFSDGEYVGVTWEDGEIVSIENAKGIEITSLAAGLLYRSPHDGREATLISTQPEAGTETFSLPQATNAALVATNGGYANNRWLSFGYYYEDSTGRRHSGEIFGNHDRAGTAKDVDASSIPQDQKAGFYLKNCVTGHTFYTENNANRDGFDHAWVFPHKNGWTIAWEDLWRGGDQDRQDYIVSLSIKDDK